MQLNITNGNRLLVFLIDVCMVQFLKFSSVGILNAVIDFGVLNLLILVFGTGAHGELYIVWKAVSFIMAVINSYFFNKYWVFASTGALTMREPSLFFLVSAIGLIINVSISTGVFAAAVALYGISHHLAANIGAVVGSAIVLVWNFCGYKFIVFKKNHDTE